MGVFDIFSYSKIDVSLTEKTTSLEITTVSSTSARVNSKVDSVTTKAMAAPAPTIIIPSTSIFEQPSTAPSSIPRRFSFRRPFGFPAKTSSDNKSVLSTTHDQQKRAQASQDLEKRVFKAQASKPDRRAQQYALAVRAIIVGPSAAPPELSPTTAKPRLSAIRSQLLEPKSANKVIAHLRALPAHDGDLQEGEHHLNGPIHAVCLQHTDTEEHQLHFSKLTKTDFTQEISTRSAHLGGVAFAPIEQITNMFHEMHLVDLLGSGDLGLGEPGDGKGILAGAVPTAETVMKGFEQITPELMALGYATGKAITPDHSGIHPPTDRMSILTYWWGFELLLPPPSLVYLAKAQSVSGSVMNFLSAVALVNNGVQEILPFIRYISQFVDFEFNTIQAQDAGSGVVCAATWIIPAALVPRPWDFPPPSTATPDGTARTQPNDIPVHAAPDLASTPATIASSVCDVVATTSPVKSRGILLKARA